MFEIFAEKEDQWSMRFSGIPIRTSYSYIAAELTKGTRVRLVFLQRDTGVGQGPKPADKPNLTDPELVQEETWRSIYLYIYNRSIPLLWCSSGSCSNQNESQNGFSYSIFWRVPAGHRCQEQNSSMEWIFQITWVIFSLGHSAHVQLLFTKLFNLLQVK